MTGGGENLRAFLTPASGVAWAKMTAQLTVVAALFIFLASHTWGRSGWPWWCFVVLHSISCAVIIVRRGVLLRKGGANDWRTVDRVLFGVHYVSAIVGLVGLFVFEGHR